MNWFEPLAVYQLVNEHAGQIALALTGVILITMWQQRRGHHMRLHHKAEKKEQKKWLKKHWDDDNVDDFGNTL
jgi:hypothetical protein